MNSKSAPKKLKPHKRLLRLSNHPFIVPMATFLVLFMASIVALVNFNGVTVGPGDSRVVQLYVDGKTQTLPTRAPTVGDLLKRLNINLNQGDQVEPAPDTQILQDNFQVNVYRAKPVTVVDGNKKTTILTVATAPTKIAKQAGVSLSPIDRVTPSLPEEAASNQAVGPEYTVERAPTITINLYGNNITVNSWAKTVGDLLKEKAIITQANDVLDPKPSTPVTNGMTVTITNMNKQVITAEEDTPMPIQIIDDPTIVAGQIVIRQPGAPGRNIVTYQLQLQNGKEVSRTKIQSVHVSDPVTQVEARGTKVVSLTGSKADWMSAAGISPSDYVYADYVIGRESGWRPNAVSANRCVGLGQSCSSGLISACPSWQTDPVCQLQFFTNYASRYGGWSGAYYFWQSNRWW